MYIWQMNCVHIYICTFVIKLTECVFINGHYIYIYIYTCNMCKQMDGVYIYMCKQIDCVFTFFELWLFLHVFTWLCLILMKLQHVMHLYCHVEFNNCKKNMMNQYNFKCELCNAHDVWALDNKNIASLCLLNDTSFTMT